jgi:hypothetical protein
MTEIKNAKEWLLCHKEDLQVLVGELKIAVSLLHDHNIYNEDNVVKLNELIQNWEKQIY